MPKEQPTTTYQGSPCKHCGSTLKYTSCRKCVSCNRTAGTVSWNRQKSVTVDVAPGTTYEGRICRNCQTTERYVKTNCCKHCELARGAEPERILAERERKQRRQLTQDYKEYHNRYRTKHHDRVIEQTRKWQRDNPDYAPKYYRLRRYGLTPDQYDALLTQQDYRCAICKTHQAKLVGRQKRLCVDHDHTTETVRGLLCNNCNRCLGLMKDNPECLQNAIDYLEHK